MDVDPYSIKLKHTNLLDQTKTESSRFEYLPALWQAAEALTAPDLDTRRGGLGHIVEYAVASDSPLIAYILATRIIEPDIELRTRIVKILGGASTALQEQSIKEPAFSNLPAYLAQMRTRQIFSLLEVVEYDPSAEEAVTALLSLCSFAGVHLGEILSERRHPIKIRELAAFFIGQIGYVDALPALERLVNRIESRMNGKNGAYDRSLNEINDIVLLSPIKNSINKLHAP